MERAAGYAAGGDREAAGGGRSEKELKRKVELLRYVDSRNGRAGRRRPSHGFRNSARSLHEKAFTTNQESSDYRQLSTLRYRDGGVEREMAVPKVDPLHRFRKDVENGNLPAVSWLVPSDGSPIIPGRRGMARGTCRDAGYPDQEPGSVEEDDLHPHLRRKRRLLRSRSAVRRARIRATPESGKTSPGIDASMEYLPLEQDLKRHPAKEARGRSGGPGLSRAAGGRFAVEPRRICLFAGLRPYLRSSVTRTRDESSGAGRESGRRTSRPGGGPCAAISRRSFSPSRWCGGGAVSTEGFVLRTGAPRPAPAYAVGLPEARGRMRWRSRPTGTRRRGCRGRSPACGPPSRCRMSSRPAVRSAPTEIVSSFRSRLATASSEVPRPAHRSTSIRRESFADS